MIKSKKYRIKIVTFKSDKKKFYPQVRSWLIPFIWYYIDYDGKTTLSSIESESKKEAENWIKLHKIGNNKVRHIGYYIMN
jgi:hypothetical protein